MQHRNKRKHQPRRKPNNKMASTIDPKLLIKPASPIAETNFKSKMTFADFNVHNVLTKNIASKGYKRPTEIQEKVISSLLDGKDLIGIAATGTGKTGAF